uniref:Uncharacterized protein n=1 Tax=Panagrolaimus sp. ES5 TaxID=591445 RepID=A0AC34GYA7_9BILA
MTLTKDSAPSVTANKGFAKSVLLYGNGVGTGLSNKLSHQLCSSSPSFRFKEEFDIKDIAAFGVWLVLSLPPPMASKGFPIKFISRRTVANIPPDSSNNVNGSPENCFWLVSDEVSNLIGEDGTFIDCIVCISLAAKHIIIEEA